jgi:hypothetical protein
MKKLLFAFAAVLFVSGGAALADEYPVAVGSDSAPKTVIMQRKHEVMDRNYTAMDPGYEVKQNERGGDAAPESRVLAAGPLDHTTTAAIEAPEYGLHVNDRYGDAQPSMR